MTTWDGKTIGDQDRVILEAVRDGFTQQEIADVIKRTRQHVNSRLKVWVARGVVTAPELVPNKLTDEGRKLLRKVAK